MITVICVLLAVGAVVAIPTLMAVGDRFPRWYTPLSLAGAAVGVVCMVGLWRMKKWAVHLYLAMTAAVQIVLLTTGLWTPLSIVVPAVLIAVMFTQLKKMT